MREREAIVSALFVGLGLVGACGRPADPGYYVPPSEGGSAGTTNTNTGGTGATDPDPTTAEPPPPEDEPETDGGSGAELDASAEPEPEPDPEEPLPAPDYDPAVIMDDGVLHIWTLGDSITVGVEGGFRNDIYNLLGADGYKVDLVGTLK